MTAQYPALPGLSSLSRWLTWITVHTPRSGLVIKTVTEGIRAISLSLALSSFSLLLLSPPLDPHSSFSLIFFPPSPSASFQLSRASGSTWTRRPSSSPVSSTFFLNYASLSNPPPPPQSSLLCLLISLHPSISVHWIWCCVIVSASLLGWRLSKGPQDPHTLRVSSHARDALSVLSSRLVSVHLVPLHLHRMEEKVKSCLFQLLLLLFIIKITLFFKYLLYILVLKKKTPLKCYKIPPKKYNK